MKQIISDTQTHKSRFGRIIQVIKSSEICEYMVKEDIKCFISEHKEYSLITLQSFNGYGIYSIVTDKNYEVGDECNFDIEMILLPSIYFVDKKSEKRENNDL